MFPIDPQPQGPVSDSSLIVLWARASFEGGGGDSVVASHKVHQSQLVALPSRGKAGGTVPTWALHRSWGVGFSH